MGYLDQEISSPKDLSDEEILALSIDSPSQFAHIVARYEAAFLRKTKAILGNQSEVEDIVQEAFTKIYLNATRFRVQEGASFKSWAYRILINTTFTHYKKLKRQHSFFSQIDDEIFALIPDLSENTMEKESMRDMVASILSRMPQNLARILKLHFIDDVSQKDIAEQEGLSVPAVKTRIHRAKKEFKKVNETLVAL